MIGREEVLFRSMMMGLAVAAPVGPMALLCMRRSLRLGWRRGLATGIGIASGDGIYAAVAALGLAGVTRFLFVHAVILRLLAGVALIYLGVRVWRSHPPLVKDVSSGGLVGGSSLADFFSAIWLTLANLPTILTFMALFSTLAPRGRFDPDIATITVVGVFGGSALWWCGVVGIMTAFQPVIGGAPLRWIDRGAGLALMIFGLVDLSGVGWALY